MNFSGLVTLEDFFRYFFQKHSFTIIIISITYRNHWRKLSYRKPIIFRIKLSFYSNESSAK